ncbi:MULTISPECIES: hypothetical protein [Streptomyces]|uniref:Uncharacterized protein n=1 Tax=Streptomyces solicathayae TaxID=3081768 RepID=A0ABZ0LMW3_9ACTN|nr:hypothetical protein [Streptomyces sp. HUAS YS2]WOX20824.1 hypothetical protein R2D22_05205 [Streptomyces sp. HUAS YS2]
MTAGAFEAATGDGPRPGGGDAEQRSRDVRAAFDGLLQIRRATNDRGGDPLALPAEWERRQPVRAVALALEAAGIVPSAVDAATGERSEMGVPPAEGWGSSATGYRVTAGDRPGAVVVEWVGAPGSGAAHEEEQALGACVPVLGRLGWEALLYRGPRKRRFLEVEAVGPDLR